MADDSIELKSIKPVAELADFVESIWMIKNHSDVHKDIVVMPDGRFDIIFFSSLNGSFHATLRGLDTRPDQAQIPANAIMFAVSFKLLAIEYMLDLKMASVLNTGKQLSDDFWGIVKDDLLDFEAFCIKISQVMSSQIKPEIDSRKKKLFELIYNANGSMPVSQLSEQVFWSSRQIGRYFNEQFGISLKAFSNILRFRASLQQIKQGRFFPEQNFSDQTHFIKEIKKFSGVVPKELSKNENDRFILLSALPKE